MRTPKIARAVEYKDISPDSMRATNDAQGIVEGYLNRVGNIDGQDDRTMPGAFRKTLADSYARKSAQGLDFLWPFLWSHNWDTLPPGGIYDADEDRQGLYIKTQLNLDIQSGRELYSSFKMGTVKKLSMGYKTIQSNYEKFEGRSIRNLIEVAVQEGSAVVFPANDLAQASLVKSTGGASMLMRAKDFDSRYQDQQVDDWNYADWNDLTTALKQAITDCFTQGSDPAGDFETQVASQVLAALRAYVAAGIALDASSYLAEQGSSDYTMMSAGGGFGQKSGYLNASDHASIKESSAAIMKHAKIIQSASANVERANARARANQLQGYNVYSSASAPSYFEEKEAEADINLQLKLMNTRLEVESDLREIREMQESTPSPLMAGVNAALARLIESKRR